MLAHEVLVSFAVVLCVAAVSTVVCQRLKLPVILGYVIAGILVGPHLHIGLVAANEEIAHALSELGVILLMFAIGLEFRLKKLVEVAGTAGIVAVIHTSSMLFIGYQVAQLFGWSTIESVFTGAIIAISSTAIVAKAYDEEKVDGVLRTLVLGELVVEDLIAILLLSSLTALAGSGGGVDLDKMAMTTARLIGFLLVVLVVGMLIVPRVMRAVVALGRNETTLVATVGVAFAMALLAERFEYSVALGAFIGGMLVAESGHQHEIEHLLAPVRDVFAATFFVSVGMLIDPKLVFDNIGAVVVLTVVVIVGKVVAVSTGAFLVGSGVQTSVRAGVSLAQIGEFSFIIASLGTTLKVTGSFLYPVAVAVSVLTTLTTPLFVRHAGAIARRFDHALPDRLQTFSVLYASWVEQAKASRASTAPLIKKVQLLALDVSVLMGLVIITSLFAHPLAVGVHKAFDGVPEMWVERGIDVVIGAVVLTLVYGMVHLTRRIAILLAQRAMPNEAHQENVSVPRHLLMLTIQLAVLAAVGIPVLALTVPFLPSEPSGLAFLAFLVVFGIALWRSTFRLQDHVRAGTHVLIEALARTKDATLLLPRAASTSSEPAPAETQSNKEDDVLSVLSSLGDPATVTLTAGDAGIGKSLGDLDVRGITDASVLLIVRDGQGLEATDDEVLREGDLVALAGSHSAIDDASALLTGKKESALTPLARTTGNISLADIG